MNQNNNYPNNNGQNQGNNQQYPQNNNQQYPQNNNQQYPQNNNQQYPQNNNQQFNNTNGNQNNNQQQYNPNNFQQQNLNYQNPNYQNQQTQNQIGGMYQPNNIGQNMELNYKWYNQLNFKIIISIILIIVLLCGISYFVYNKINSNIAQKQYESLDIDAKLVLAISQKVDKVKKDGNKEKINFMVYYLNLYNVIFNDTNDRQSFNNNINSVNFLITDTISNMKNSSVYSDKDYQAILNKIINSEIKLVPIMKKTIDISITKDLPNIKTTNDSEKTTKDLFNKGLISYNSFLTIYGEYLKSPNEDKFAKSIKAQQEAVKILHQSYIEYATSN